MDCTPLKIVTTYGMTDVLNFNIDDVFSGNKDWLGPG